MGVLAVSPTFPSREYDRAIEVAESIGASLRIIDTNELEDDRLYTVALPYKAVNGERMGMVMKNWRSRKILNTLTIKGTVRALNVSCQRNTPATVM